MTQTEWVRLQLIAGRALTPMDALKEAGCFRLAARVDELRNMGMRITATLVQRHSKRFSEYRLAR